MTNAFNIKRLEDINFKSKNTIIAYFIKSIKALQNQTCDSEKKKNPLGREGKESAPRQRGFASPGLIKLKKNMKAF